MNEWIMKDVIEKKCPVCREIFLSTKGKRAPRGLRQKVTVRPSTSYTCSKKCALIYERVRQNLKSRGFKIINEKTRR